MLHRSLILSFLLVGTVIAGANWPGFRGTGDSLSDAKNLPLKWSDDEGIAWTADIKGYGQSSPVVHGDKVFVNSVDGKDKTTLHVSAFELRSGKPLWVKTFVGTQGIEDSDYTSKAPGTPCVDDKAVYAFFESGELIALDHDGNTLWQRSLTKEYGNFLGNHGVGCSPAQTKDKIIVLIDHDGPGYLLAIDKATGKNAWKVDREKRVSWSSPVVATRDGKEIIILSSNGVAQGFSAQDGKRLWGGDGVQGNTVAAPTVAGDLIIISSSKEGYNFALKAGTQGDLKDADIRWRAENVVGSFCSPLVLGEFVYFVNKVGVAFCVKRATGEDVWLQRLGDSCWASPIGVSGKHDEHGERAYFFTKGGTTLVIAGGGETAKVLAENKLTLEGRQYGVAAVDGAFVIRSGRKLICVGAPSR
ncbi:MAG: PQQ-binding-like beta-propeller repeat protein [Phycisphaeraceae bacterium]